MVGQAQCLATLLDECADAWSLQQINTQPGSPGESLTETVDVVNIHAAAIPLAVKNAKTRWGG
jgi:hypothetical protein